MPCILCVCAADLALLRSKHWMRVCFMLVLFICSEATIPVENEDSATLLATALGVEKEVSVCCIFGDCLMR